MRKSSKSEEIDTGIEAVTLNVRREILRIIADGEVGKMGDDFEPTAYRISKKLEGTGGNISYHIQKLVSEGLLLEKEKPDRKKRRYKTYYSLTKRGHKTIINWADNNILELLPSFQIEIIDIPIGYSLYEKIKRKIKKIDKEENALEILSKNIGLKPEEALQGLYILYAKDPACRWWINYLVKNFRPGRPDSRYKSWDEYLSKI